MVYKCVATSARSYLLWFTSVRDLSVWHVQLDLEAGSVIPFCSVSSTEGHSTCQVLVPSMLSVGLFFLLLMY